MAAESQGVEQLEFPNYTIAMNMGDFHSDADYWARTSGGDLDRMLQQAAYPEEVRTKFATWYRETICPLLGHRPRPDSAKCGIGWDGNPLEYSFEISGSAKEQIVRFVVDLTQLRPINPNNRLGIRNAEKVLQNMASCTPGFDDTWYRALKEYMMYDHLAIKQQETLIKQAGQATQLILGFDISRKLGKPDDLPVMGKVYFPPCFAAHARDLTRWAASYEAIRQMPGIEKHPNVLSSAALINEYFEDKPITWQQGVRWLATDLVEPATARFKVYLRCFKTDFEDIWDFYTLGGRLPDLESDKAEFRSLLDALSGASYESSRNDKDMGVERFQSVTRKLTAIYFSLSPKNPYPSPKLCIYPSNFTNSDEKIAKGLDKWLLQQRWSEDDTTMTRKVENSIIHRSLAESTGIFTFIGIGRKSKDKLSIQTYLTPELYRHPRFEQLQEKKRADSVYEGGEVPISCERT